MSGAWAAGTEKGMAETFGSTCHGAGRAASRNSSRRNLDYTKARPCCSHPHTQLHHTHIPGDIV